MQTYILTQWQVRGSLGYEEDGLYKAEELSSRQKDTWSCMTCFLSLAFWGSQAIKSEGGKLLLRERESMTYPKRIHRMTKPHKCKARYRSNKDPSFYSQPLRCCWAAVSSHVLLLYSLSSAQLTLASNSLIYWRKQAAAFVTNKDRGLSSRLTAAQLYSTALSTITWSLGS